MPINRFSVSLTIKNGNVFKQIQARIFDWSKVYHAIIERWTAHNQSKFDMAKGAHDSGVQFDVEGEAFVWKPLDPDYADAKEDAGYTDWLMVRDGELMRSLTENEEPGWFQEVEPLRTTFGTLLKQAFYNAITRPTQFLDAEDRATIQDMVDAWLNGKPPFVDYQPGDTKRMDAEFRAMFRMT